MLVLKRGQADRAPPASAGGMHRNPACACTLGKLGRHPSDKNLAKGSGRLCFLPLSMQKTKKSIAKRFKLSGTGKLIRRTPGFRHLLGAKSTKQKRRASRDKLVAEGHAKPLKRALPFGL